MTAAHERAGSANASAGDRDGVWSGIARSYAAFGSPFVPCHSEIETYQRAVCAHAEAAGVGGVRALMLGVTPGLALMHWPQDSQVLAAEISPAVIEALWPGDVPGTRAAVCASWFAIPAECGSCDVVVGDGVLAICRFPGEVRELLRCVSELLAENGVLIVRSYIRPHITESLDALFDELFGARRMTVDCFKLRLYLAMQRSVREGVRVKDAARILERYKLDRQVMLEQLGWSKSAVEPFALWRNSDATYSFPTLDELRDMTSELFDDFATTYPDYELAHCCPILVMRKRRSAVR